MKNTLTMIAVAAMAVTSGAAPQGDKNTANTKLLGAEPAREAAQAPAGSPAGEAKSHAFHTIRLKQADAGGYYFMPVQVEGNHCRFLVDSGSGQPIVVAKVLATHLKKNLREEGVTNHFKLYQQ